MPRSAAHPDLFEVHGLRARLGYAGDSLFEGHAAPLQGRDCLTVVRAEVKEQLADVDAQALLDGGTHILTQVVPLNHVEPDQLPDDLLFDDAVDVEVWPREVRNLRSDPMPHLLNDSGLEQVFGTMTTRDDLWGDVHIDSELIEIGELGAAHVTDLDVTINLGAVRLAQPVLNVTGKLFVGKMRERSEIARQLAQGVRPVHDPGEPAPAVGTDVEMHGGLEKSFRRQPSQVVTRQLLRFEMA
jgi:hypothetical protein